MESIPEVLEDKESSTEQSDTASVHDIDYVNPRGVRFTQSTQRDGESPFVLFVESLCRYRQNSFLRATLENLQYAVSETATFGQSSTVETFFKTSMA